MFLIQLLYLLIQMRKLRHEKLKYFTQVSEETSKTRQSGSRMFSLSLSSQAPTDELQLPWSLPAASLQLPHLSYNSCELVGKPVSVRKEISQIMLIMQCKEDTAREGFSAQNSASGSVSHWHSTKERHLMKSPPWPTHKKSGSKEQK